jgi:hypothetical protein
LPYVPRTLWYETEDQRREKLGEGELLRRPEPLVVLGEPGMGKSELLQRLADAAGLVPCTARQLINRPDPSTLVGTAPLIVIDALDEVPTRQEGDVVDRVLQKLGLLHYPRFILSCRVADWMAATSVAAIREQYPASPLQLHLEPLSREDQVVILSDRVGETRAGELIGHFETLGLDFLGNPQTLDLIARLPHDKPLPSNASALFDLAVEQMRVEHRRGLVRPEMPRETVLDAAGAAFAALILLGGSTISRVGTANLVEGALSFAEIDALAGGHLAGVIGTRLFAGGEDSFTYWHRQIGEFLWAAWLARRADNREKRRRLLHLFNAGGLVPASLRGLHAWLARDRDLAEAVIAADPMGVVEYGDANALTEREAQVLFAHLEKVAQENPRFWRGGVARAGTLVSPPMQPQTDRVILDRQAPLALRLLLLEQISEAERAEPYRATLRHLLGARSDIFAVRWQAGDALARLKGEDWPAHVAALLDQASADSHRLAYEMMERVGLAAFSERQIADAVQVYGGLVSCAWPRQKPTRLAARFWRLPERLPPAHLDGVLDILATELPDLMPRGDRIEHDDVIHALFGLLLRRLDLGRVEPLRLWEWLQPLRDRSHYRHDKVAALGQRLRTMVDVRRAIQRHVLLDDSDKTIFQKHHRLARVSPGLTADEADVVDLLAAVGQHGADDRRWFDLLCLISHDQAKGLAARQAAASFAQGDACRLELIRKLAEPSVPAWQIENEREAQERATERVAWIEQTRAAYLENSERMRTGDPRWLAEPAGVYLKRYADLGDGIPAEERVAELLGTELAAAAHDGFEVFLTSQPPRPSATRMALSFATGRRYVAADIIVAALAERQRLRAEPFGDLADERLMAGLFELWSSGVEQRSGLEGLADRLEADLRNRGAWEEAVRLYIGTQFRRRREQVDQLYRFMRSDADASLATALAIDWLQACPDMPAGPEAELIDLVLRSSRIAELGPIGEARRAAPLDERRRNWDAVQVILDLDAASGRLAAKVEPELIWHIRSRTASDGRDDRPNLSLDPRQMAWIVATFRTTWPARAFPSGSYTGDTNPWDATSYLSDLISRLGENTVDDAVAAISDLRDSPRDGYTDHIRAVAAEQWRKRVEQAYEPATIQEMAAILEGGAPSSAADLQAVMLEDLDVVQAMLRGSDVDWYKGFFRDDGRHRDEESCRDEIIKMLREIDRRLDFIPESHGADEKRVDIVVKAAQRLILPVEIKGQWHRELWTAADTQLDHLYVADWRAERGIYLVLWFGERVKGLPVGINPPSTAEELRHALVSTSRAAQAGRVDVVVLDLTRPATR